MILPDEAEAEGGYSSHEYEELYEKMHPGWIERWAYLFQYYPTEAIELIEDGELDEAMTVMMSIASQQLRKTSVLRSESAEHPDTGEADTQPVPASSGREKEEKT
ncbi:MAG TPA: hypothetical protein VMW50_02935 [Dehalococcoidia bacterium]|nr:hypothetical protein [Dehalococcoidia bacterium]